MHAPLLLLLIALTSVFLVLSSTAHASPSTSVPQPSSTSSLSTCSASALALLDRHQRWWSTVFDERLHEKERATVDEFMTEFADDVFFCFGHGCERGVEKLHHSLVQFSGIAGNVDLDVKNVRCGRRSITFEFNDIIHAKGSPDGCKGIVRGSTVLLYDEESRKITSYVSSPYSLREVRQFIDTCQRG